MRPICIPFPGEVWKPVPDMFGYSVSSMGRVRSHWWYAHGLPRGERQHREEGWLVSQQTSSKGHKRVFIGRGDKRGWQSVHRLVLLAFVGPCPDGKCCCHNNGEPGDNRLENLRWDTFSENTQDSVRHGTHDPKRGDRQSHAKLTEDLVHQIRKTSGRKSALKWSREIGCSPSLIWRVRNRKIWAWLP